MLYHRDYRDEILEMFDDECEHGIEEVRRLGKGAVEELAMMIRCEEVV